LRTYFASKDKEAIRQDFGKQVADALFQQIDQGWVSPIPSGYGYHLVHIDTILAASPFPFDRVKEQVAQDWNQQQQILYNERLFKNLRSQYKIEYEY